MDSTDSRAVGAPLERQVRPRGWLVRQGARTHYVPHDEFVSHSYDAAEMTPLHDASALDAVMAAERDRCARRLDVSRADVLLAAGELTAGEWRTVAAVLRWMQSRIRAA